MLTLMNCSRIHAYKRNLVSNWCHLNERTIIEHSFKICRKGPLVSFYVMTTSNRRFINALLYGPVIHFSAIYRECNAQSSNNSEFLQHRRRQPQTQNVIPYLAFSSLSSKPQLPMPAVLKNKPSTPFGQGKRVRTGGHEQATGLEFTSSSSLDVSSPPPTEVGDFQAVETLRLMFSRASQPSQ